MQVLDKNIWKVSNLIRLCHKRDLRRELYLIKFHFFLNKFLLYQLFLNCNIFFLRFFSLTPFDKLRILEDPIDLGGGGREFMNPYLNAYHHFNKLEQHS